MRGLGDELRVLDGRRVKRHLVRARRHHGAHARQVAEPTAHRIGNGKLLGRASRHVDGGGALVARGRDVKKDHLVGTLAVVGGGKLHRVTRVAQVNEVDALDDAPVLHVKAGYDALGQHETSSEDAVTAAPSATAPDAAAPAEAGSSPRATARASASEKLAS